MLKCQQKQKAHAHDHHWSVSRVFSLKKNFFKKMKSPKFDVSFIGQFTDRIATFSAINQINSTASNDRRCCCTYSLHFTNFCLTLWWVESAVNDPPALETIFSKPPVCVYIFVAFNIFFLFVRCFSLIDDLPAAWMVHGCSFCTNCFYCVVAAAAARWLSSTESIAAAFGWALGAFFSENWKWFLCFCK